jgi:hypothetical protein
VSRWSPTIWIDPGRAVSGSGSVIFPVLATQGVPSIVMRR